MPEHTVSRPVRETESEEFRRNGVVHLRNILPGELVENIRSQVDSIRQHPGPLTTTTNDGAGGRMITEQHACLQRPLLGDLTVAAGFHAVAKALHGGNTWYLVGDQCWIKEEGPMLPTPWHQDDGYSNIGGRSLLRLWVPCDPVARDQSLEFVRGSHLWNVTYRPAIAEDEAIVEGDDGSFTYGPPEAWDQTLPRVPDIAGHRDSFDIIGWACVPGDVIAFDLRILHAAGFLAKHSNLRRAYSFILGGEDAQVVARNGKTVPNRLDLLNTDYVPGQKISGFPKAFPAVK